MPTYVLVKSVLSNYPEWWMLRGNQLENPFGALCPLLPEFEILKKVEAEDFDDLDYSETSLCALQSEGLADGEVTSGWLNPEGVFYACNYKDHDRYARLVLRKSVGEIERTWLRVSWLYDELSVQNEARPTPSQLEWLSKNGVDPYYVDSFTRLG